MESELEVKTFHLSSKKLLPLCLTRLQKPTDKSDFDSMYRGRKCGVRVLWDGFQPINFPLTVLHPFIFFDLKNCESLTLEMFPLPSFIDESWSSRLITLQGMVSGQTATVCDSTQPRSVPTPPSPYPSTWSEEYEVGGHHDDVLTKSSVSRRLSLSTPSPTPSLTLQLPTFLPLLPHSSPSSPRVTTC